MKVSTFQALLVVNWLLSMVNTFTPPWILTSDPKMIDFLKYDGAGGLLGDPLYLLCFWGFVAAFTVSQFGMLYFNGWARHVFLVASVVNLLFQFLVGVRVTYPAFAALTQIVLLTDGAIIALAYYSPLAKYFKPPGTSP